MIRRSPYGLTVQVLCAALAVAFWLPSAKSQSSYLAPDAARPGIAGPGRMSLGSTWSRNGQSDNSSSRPSLFGPRTDSHDDHHGHGHHGYGHHGHGHHGQYGYGSPGYFGGYYPGYGYGGYGYGGYGYGNGFGYTGLSPGFSFYSPWVNVNIDSARYGRVYSGPAGFGTTVYGNPYSGSATYSVVPYDGISVPPVVHGYNLSAPALPVGAIPVVPGASSSQGISIDESAPLDQGSNTVPSLPIPFEENPTPAKVDEVHAERPALTDASAANSSSAKEPIVDEFKAAAGDVVASSPTDRLEGLRLQSRGDREFRSSNFAAAQEIYRSAAEATQDRAAPWLRLAWSQVAQDDFAAAVSSLKRAMQLQEHSELPWVQFAELFGPDRQVSENAIGERLWTWVDEQPNSADRMFLAAAYQYFVGLPDVGNELLDLAQEQGLARETADALRAAIKNVRSESPDGVPLPTDSDSSEDGIRIRGGSGAR